MGDFTVTCFECGSQVEALLMPYGGAWSMNPDHTYMDMSETFACRVCNELLEVVVRREIGTGKALYITSRAFPAKIYGWDARCFRFAPSGERLAVGFDRQVRVFDRVGERWIGVFETTNQTSYHLIGWHAEDVLLTDRGFWQLNDDTPLWQDRTARVSIAELGFDAQRGIVVRGGGTMRPPYQQWLEALPLVGSERVYLELGEIRDYNKHVVAWNRARGLLFCARPYTSNLGGFADKNPLELWRFDAEAQQFERVAEGRLSGGAVQRGWWAPDGTIMLAVWFRFVELVEGQTHAYGLVQLDGQTLEVLREQRWVGPLVRSSLFFRHAESLANGDVLWHSNTVSLIDGATWEVREELSYIPLPSEHIAMRPDGAFLCIGRNNDALVVNRATGRAWSLRRDRPVRLVSPGRR